MSCNEAISKNSCRRLFALSLLVPLLCACFEEGGTFTSPDGTTSSTENGIPGPWSEPFPVAAGELFVFYGLSSSIESSRFTLEIDWDSPGNDVSLLLFSGNEGFPCSVPGDFPDPDLPDCPRAIANESQDKPKRVDFVTQPGETYWVAVRNNGPGDENVRIREVTVR